MSEPFTLFEVSWEVCNKVGGIHTVLSTKARTIVQLLGDDQYVMVGPWLLSESDATLWFDDEPGFELFIDECRALGAPVRVGRWRIPGSPRTLLVSFSEQYPLRDEILTKLWLQFGVDSLGSQWDYVEPVLFGYAAAIAVQHWWRTYRQGLDSRSVVQCHEWLTGSALLRLFEVEPAMATVFTTHATTLGRAASANGRRLDEAPPGVLAAELLVKSKHSIEAVTAGQADVFTTVSPITADEATKVLGRTPSPILPNGIDLSVFDAMVGGIERGESRRAVRQLAGRFLGAPVDDAVLMAISGRYEFHNKGIDLFLDALGALDKTPGTPIVAVILVPADNSGIRKELMERLADEEAPAAGPVGLATHNLSDTAHDPIHQKCLALGLDNALAHRVKVMHIPVYLQPTDGFLDMSYEATLRGMDLTCFPSAYEPWGYTPQESLVAGVPTIASDLSGFGRWCLDNGVGVADGVRVVHRAGVPYADAIPALAELVEAAIASACESEACVLACRATAARVEWADMIPHYQEAFQQALERAAERVRAHPPAFAPTVSVPARPEGDKLGPRLFPVTVRAQLPAQLAALSRLADNFWWATDPQAVRLFQRLDPDLWSRLGHAPLALVRGLAPTTLQSKAADPDCVAAVQAVLGRFDAYMAEPLRTFPHDGPSQDRPVAYFSAEFGIHESLPMYSGGLGILAGDHLKSASDLGIPLVAIGLFYHHGFFSQRLTSSGDQIALDVPLVPDDLPMEPVLNQEGQRLDIVVRLPGGSVVLCAWKVMVGRVPVYLLDADLPENLPEARSITRNLYSADPETRLRQELLLGKGGVRLLRALGIRPSVYHLNEGHAALAGLERVAQMVGAEGLTFDEALAMVRATTIFTTHTPVAAGHDRFGPDLMRRYFSDATTWIGVPWERFFALGRKPDEPDYFNMTGLAIRVSGTVNAVSQLHRRVSQDLLAPFWPNELLGDVPVEAVTNGVHLPTWTAAEVGSLLGAAGDTIRGEDFAAAEGVDCARLWELRAKARTRLLEFAGSHLEAKFFERRDSPKLLAEMREGLTPEALVMGLARRFAPYKRADLLFKDPDRLAALLGNTKHPVRLLLAGKAHPRDDLGQEILKRVANFARDPRFVGKVILLEDHDIRLARLLVQGCDVWLNVPRHLQEASGTSGMKAAANGALNVSVADGWWPEGFDGENGWTIGGEKVYQNQDLQDELDSTLLYELLETEVVPLFFERDADGLPRRWLERVRRSLATIPPRFNTDRMVGEYAERFYGPMASRGHAMAAHGYRELRARIADQDRLRRLFPGIRILDARMADLEQVHAGDRVAARVVLDLGELKPDEVRAELVIGRPAGKRRLDEQEVIVLRPVGPEPPGGHVFQAEHVLQWAGSLAYGIRVRPNGAFDRLADADDLVLWA